MKMYLVLGDWSDDGHGNSEKVLFDINATVEEVQNAYKASCKLTGISFNHNEDFTETGHPREIANRFRIATEYESGFTLTDEVKEALATHGLSSTGADVMEPEDAFIALWMDFVKLSLPNLEYKLIEDKTPCINGYWDQNLNVQFGYGLY